MISHTLTARSYIGEEDLPRIVALIDACEAVDHLDDTVSIEELRIRISHPHLDITRDLRLWKADTGHLVGMGYLSIPLQAMHNGILDGFLWFKVHPESRGGDLETQIIAWSSTRLREVGQERSVSPTLYSDAHEHDSERRHMLEQHGLTVRRFFFEMACSLERPIPAPQVPPGFVIRTVGKHDDPAAWAEMFNLSFVDHWNHHPISVQQVQHFLQRPDYHPAGDLVAVAPDGTLAAFCYCHINHYENARHNRQDGWINVLGTRRGYRQRGLGRAMLLAGLGQLQAEGMTRALLAVDSLNPSGALRLYESLGFARTRTMLAYAKEL